ncbi:hypothetical protein IGI04_022874 [Brassica rapa subsp. trilocularis]|uniref:Uncharacterized protein n=1 Tax=Brassica rapa subsp. trilocularis TaxID=1813537 RepID=A0ABQ7M267_BRACM|nr:hypothetical protein IGI04_022874 [Brassica rapa subsp. trilocularis]
MDPTLTSSSQLLELSLYSSIITKPFNVAAINFDVVSQHQLLHVSSPGTIHLVLSAFAIFGIKPPSCLCSVVAGPPLSLTRSGEKIARATSMEEYRLFALMFL